MKIQACLRYNENMAKFFDKEPILNLSPSYLVEMRKRLENVLMICNRSFSGNINWREKESYQKRAVVLAKNIKTEEKKILGAHEEDLKEYAKFIVEMEKAEEKFCLTNPISSIFLSSGLIEDKKEESIDPDSNPFEFMEL